MSVVSRNPQIMHGTPCFAGTRVPVASLLEHLRRGYTIDYFIEQFPTVTREQAEAAVGEAAETLLGRDAKTVK